MIWRYDWPFQERPRGNTPSKCVAPLSETTWVIWRYDWPFQEGEHTFEVRCAEADGTPQIAEKQGNRPSGATGIHSRKTDM